MTDTPDAATLCAWSTLADRTPTAPPVPAAELVVVRHDDKVSVLSGRCTHRGASLGASEVQGEHLICPAHGWDYRLDSGVSDVDPCESIKRFAAWVDAEADAVCVDAGEVARWLAAHPPTDRKSVV